MNVAVLTLTRDRLEYSQHCFESLRQNAGCDYDHYVLDQGSKDGTQRWLQNGVYEGLILLNENIGCTKGWNRLLEICDPTDYDVIVCFDNDCEVLQPDTLKTIAGLAQKSEWILAPRVDGLLYPPPAIAEHHVELDGVDYLVEETTILGNIFMAIPYWLFFNENFRWDENYAVWDGGEYVTQWNRKRGGLCGYVPAFRVNHYKTTLGQKEDMPWYAERRIAEGGRAQ